ncbi:MAG: hypothetical protein QOF62_3071 [Pyrinomonadaceae bacterium]|jgi:hypothetical protein|nr:hypothetical protein [Pyrinomonadaceae bacterium]
MLLRLVVVEPANMPGKKNQFRGGPNGHLNNAMHLYGSEDGYGEGPVFIPAGVAGGVLCPSDPADGSYNFSDPQSFNRYAYIQNDPGEPRGFHGQKFLGRHGRNLFSSTLATSRRFIDVR